MILTREQIDNYWHSPDLTVADLRDTARAYHALRDAVLALCDAPDGAFMAAYVLVPRIREVVARVERGGATKGIDIHRDFGVSES